MSPAERAPDGVFDAIHSRGAGAAAVTGEAWFAALLEVESALGAAAADAGLIDRADADAITAVCVPEGFDRSELASRAVEFANPVPPLVEEIRARVGQAAASVHFGATSQDVVDSAAMVVAGRALTVIEADLDAAADLAVGLARDHADTPMLARTLLQPAVPTTFGLVAIGWAVGLERVSARLGTVRRNLPVQLGGAAGTRAAYGEKGGEVAVALADRLGLQMTTLPWHADRGPVLELAGALGEAASAVAKPALDVVLLCQGEVGELRPRDPDRGGSSAMAHKRNPVAAISTRACASLVPGSVATLHAVGAGELQRAAGAWQAEWRALSDAIRATASGAAWLRDCLGDIEVDVERMRSNLELLDAVSDSEIEAAARLAASAIAERGNSG